MLRNDARNANSANRRGLISPKPYYRISQSGMRCKNIKFAKKKKTKKVEDFRKVFGFKIRIFHDALGLSGMWRARLGPEVVILHTPLSIYQFGAVGLYFTICIPASLLDGHIESSYNSNRKQGIYHTV